MLNTDTSTEMIDEIACFGIDIEVGFRLCATYAQLKQGLSPFARGTIGLVSALAHRSHSVATTSIAQWHEVLDRFSRPLRCREIVPRLRLLWSGLTSVPFPHMSSSHSSCALTL